MKRMTGMAIASAFVLAAGTAGAAEAGPFDWPQWRGPGRDGISLETGWSTNWPASGPAVLWKAEIGPGYAAASVSRGRAFIGGYDVTAGDEVIYAFGAADGKELWTARQACPRYDMLNAGGPATTPVVDGDLVYTLTRHGHLLCLNAASGEKVWVKELRAEFGVPERRSEWGYSGSPLVLGDLLIVDAGGKGASTVALRKADGALAWKGGDSPFAYASPVAFAVGGKTFVALMKDSSACVLDPADGREVAAYPWKTSYDVNASTPLVAGDRLFISSGYKHGAALVKFTGAALEKVWESADMQTQFASCVLVNGFVYGLSDDKALRCLDLETGAVKWSQRGLKAGGLMVAAGRLIVLTEGGDLVIADAKPDAYVERVRARVAGSGKFWTMPVLANGRIYCRSDRGSLVCVDVNGK